jgi:hypothetical protein
MRHGHGRRPSFDPPKPTENASSVSPFLSGLCTCMPPNSNVDTWLTLIPISFPLLDAQAISYVSAADYQIVVGREDAVFTPNNVTAVEGDTVTFTFVNGTHAVLQSSLYVAHSG